MKESLYIKNLGPLSDVRMDEIRPVMVLVGETGSGKSLLLKTLAMMRHVCKMHLLRRALKNSGVRRTHFRIRRDSYLQFADMTHLMHDSTSIVYHMESGGVSCEISLEGRVRAFNASFNEAAAGDAGPFIKIAFISDTRNLIPAWAMKGASIQSKVLDNFFAETYQDWDSATDNKLANSNDIRFLGYTIKVSRAENGRKRIVLKDEKGVETLLERAASGQKSSVPVALIVRHLISDYDFSADIRRKFVQLLVETMLEENQGDVTRITGRALAKFHAHVICLHIEEPELSLDPETQLKFAEDLMTTLDRSMSESKPSTSVIYTTHSPYWVSALNTILEERSHPFVTWERVGGYQITSDGTLITLRDEEMRMLMMPNMDRATRMLDERYSAALSREGV